MDANAERARASPRSFRLRVLPDLECAAPDGGRRERGRAHGRACRVGCRLLEQGIDVLVEKPIAASLAEADRLIAAARATAAFCKWAISSVSIPASSRRCRSVNRPLYFEVHRLGVFTPRSLDMDVVYDVMIHDLDILLAMVGAPVTDVRALGIPVVTDKVDIAHARLEFASGAVANVTASRVSVERVRKLRFFQQHEYISVDYAAQGRFAHPRAAAGPAAASLISSSSGRASRSRWKANCAHFWTPCATRNRRWWMAPPAAARWNWRTA